MSDSWPVVVSSAWAAVKDDANARGVLGPGADEYLPYVCYPLNIDA